MTTTRGTTGSNTESPRDARAAPTGATLIEVRDIGKSYGSVIALRDVTTTVNAGEVTCVLGDNGAGKSTFIKILAGAHTHTNGALVVDGEERHFSSPREALNLGIATVYQDLAVVPLMPVWRNFFLGSELTKGVGPLKRLDIAGMKKVTKAELSAMGIDLRDVDQPIGTLSGGERQCVAIARAVYFGARVLILDEPTAALGVRQSGRRAEVRRQGARPGPRRHLHHPQPPPRLSGGRPLRHPETRRGRPGQEPVRGLARRADEADGRRRRADRGLYARARALTRGRGEGQRT